MSTPGHRAGTAAKDAVGAVQAGARGKVIPDHAVLPLNMRSYCEPTRQRMLQDFGVMPASPGVPYTYWGTGRTDRHSYLAADQAGRLRDLPSHHSPKFLPPLQPTLRTGTKAMAGAAMAWPGRQ